MWKTILPAAALLCGAILPGAEIPRGAHVLLRLTNSISTKTAKPGDHVYLRTASPLTAGDRIAIPVGSYVEGVVTHARRGGRIKGRAELGIRLETLTLPSGRNLKFSSALDSVDAGSGAQKVESSENAIGQGGEKGRDAGIIAITAGSGAALGAIVDRGARGAGIGAGAGGAVGLARVMLNRGPDVVLRQGSSLDVVLQRPLVLE